MRAISWNVNGLRAAHKKGFLDWFNDESPDIMCLQETKAHAEQLPEAVRTIEGYSSYFSTPEKKGTVELAFTRRRPPQAFNLVSVTDLTVKVGR